MKEKLSPKLCTSSSTADSVCSCSFPAFCDCIGASCLICCFCSPEFSSGHPLSFCHQLLSSCLICLRAPSLICQEPLFSSTGPLLFNLPRDPPCSSEVSPGLLLSVCHQLFSSCLNLLRASSPTCQEPLLSNSGPLLFLLPRDPLLQPRILDL